MCMPRISTVIQRNGFVNPAFFQVLEAHTPIEDVRDSPRVRFAETNLVATTLIFIASGGARLISR